MSLLSVSSDAKTVKGEKQGYLTGVMYLAPSNLSGRNLCPDASPGCIATCLNTAGRGVFSNVQQGRIKRSHAFRNDRVAYMVALSREVAALVRKAKRQGMTPLVRLNGTSDLPWENIPVVIDGAAYRNIFDMFPGIQFYDYTKSARRMGLFLVGRMPANYHLTFSRSECNEVDALGVLLLGGNVAIPFSTKRGAALPAEWRGYRVVDGDVSDVRTDDARGVVIGLRAKGKARRDTSGFVVAA